MPICYLALDRLNLQVPMKGTGTLDASTNSWKLGGTQRVARYLIGHGLFLQEFVRQIEEPSRVVEFTDSDHAGCLRTRKSASSTKLFYVSHMLHSTSTKEGVIALSSEESELYTLVKGTSAGLVSMLKDLGVNISKTPKLIKQKCELARPLDEAKQYNEEPGEFGTLPLQHCGCKSSHKTAESKSRKSLEPRAWQISEPDILTEDQFEEHWKSVTVTFVKEGLESRCGQKCDKSRDHVLKFSLSVMQVNLTRSQKRKSSLNSIDDESSDAVNLKQLRDQMV